MDALAAIAARKSVRDYLAQPVEQDKIDALLIAAGSAPKAGDFHISVVENTDVLKAVNDTALQVMLDSGNDFLTCRAKLPGYQPLYGAPLLFLFSGPATNPYTQANASNACTTALLAATALGLGSCYLVTPTLALGADDTLAARIGVPQGYTAVCGGIFGYAGDTDKYVSERKPFDSFSYCR